MNLKLKKMQDMNEYLEPVRYNTGKVDWTYLTWDLQMILRIESDIQEFVDDEKLDLCRGIVHDLFQSEIYKVLNQSLVLYQAYEYKGSPTQESIIEIPYNALEQVCRVFAYGAEVKYSRDNYKLAPGLPLESYVQSMWRHLVQYLRGEELDIESQLPSLAHLSANCFMYLWTVKHYHSN